MKYSKINTSVIQGLSVRNIDLEVSLLKGLPRFEISGLSVRKGQEMYGRVKATLLNNGYQIPRMSIMCHLSEELQQVQDNSLDLALACAILIADDQIQISKKFKEDITIIGGLNLSGEVAAIKGVYAMLQQPKTRFWILPKMTKDELIFQPENQLKNCFLVEDINQVVDVLTNKNLSHYQIDKYELFSERILSEPIALPKKLQPLGQLAIEIAVAGWHPALIVGSPDSDKPLLKNNVAQFLPLLDDQSYIEIRSLYSIKGLWQDVLAKKEIQSFELLDPNYSKQEILGGRSELRPGVITMAHQGILYLEDINMYKLDQIRLLRKPMDDQFVTLGSQNNQQVYPANFLLLASMAPCPCGYFFEEAQSCDCSKTDINKFKEKIKLTILDKFQLTIILRESAIKKIIDNGFQRNITKQEYKKIIDRILKARSQQKLRCQKHNLDYAFNSNVKPQNFLDFFRLSNKTLQQYGQGNKRKNLSLNAFQNLIRIARTIADLNEDQDIELKHLYEAYTLRVKENIY
ncbi:MAG: hypothetical protein GX326_06000 [Clostridiaceae bacterium]|nr:hypothetical protein [Clostridiaceae bacterium]